MKKSKNNKKMQNTIYSNFKDSLNYVKESRNYIYFSIGLFLIFLFIAIIFPTSVELDSQIKLLIKSLILKTQNLNPLELVAFIFVNNLSVAIIAILFGVFFCIAPLIIAASNGYVLGYVIKALVESLGALKAILSLWKLLPHGIFELPAIFIGLGIGLKMGTLLISSLNKSSFKLFLDNLWKSIKIIFYVILPLLIIAATIEGILIKIL